MTTNKIGVFTGLVFFLSCWAIALMSPTGADAFVEVGLFSPGTQSLGFPLPGANGVVIGLFNVLMFVSVGLVATGVALACRETVVAWDTPTALTLPHEDAPVRESKPSHSDSSRSIEDDEEDEVD